MEGFKRNWKLKKDFQVISVPNYDKNENQSHCDSLKTDFFYKMFFQIIKTQKSETHNHSAS